MPALQDTALFHCIFRHADVLLIVGAGKGPLICDAERREAERIVWLQFTRSPRMLDGFVVFAHACFLRHHNRNSSGDPVVGDYAVLAWFGRRSGKSGVLPSQASCRNRDAIWPAIRRLRTAWLVNLIAFSLRDLDELRSFSSAIEDDVFEALTLEQTLGSKSVAGGTAPERVAEALANARRTL